MKTRFNVITPEATKILYREFNGEITSVEKTSEVIPNRFGYIVNGTHKFTVKYGNITRLPTYHLVSLDEERKIAEEKHQKLLKETGLPEEVIILFKDDLVSYDNALKVLNQIKEDKENAPEELKKIKLDFEEYVHYLIKSTNVIELWILGWDKHQRIFEYVFDV